MFFMSNLIYVLSYNIRSAYNIGAIFRTADGAGVNKIILGGYTPSPSHQKVSKTALGAEKNINWEKVSQSVKKIDELKKEGFQIIGLEIRKKIKFDFYYNFKPRFPCLLILGNETKGLPSRILKKCDKIITIPMRGKKESLNVSVAFGIVIYHLSNFKFKNYQ